MILTCREIKKSFGVENVLSGATFYVDDNEKVAIAGINGAGKSTLLKIIMGELSPDAGEIIISKGTTVGYQSQHSEAEEHLTIYEEVSKAKQEVIELEQIIKNKEQMMSECPEDEMDSFMEEYHRLCHQFEMLNGYAYQSEIMGVIRGLGFSEEESRKKIGELSGGQRTRVALAKLLVQHPDMILLDEPTNHLDIASIEWLEGFLKGYKGAVVIVSHDRYFLDKIVDKVVEIENHVTISYPGNYTEFAKKKEQVREAQLKKYLEQQKEIKHHEEVVARLRSYNREKSIKRAESREKLLEKIERVEKPMEVHADMHITFQPAVKSGNDVLSVENLAKSYPGNPLFHDLNFEIKRGERVAIIGANGTGKTTILKLLNDMIPADRGTVRLGTNVMIGYYDQEQKLLEPENELFDEIQDAFPTLTNTQVRNVLAAFLFTDDDVFKRIKDLSGGERGRMSLAKLMLSEANFLILDEPTNHLDVTSKEILENALNHYSGTVLYVSHDRYFINQTATRILELSNGTLKNYLGNYDYYLMKKQQTAEPDCVSSSDKTTKSESDGSLDWKKQKEQQAEKRKHENAVKKVESEIAKLEGEIAAINEKLSDSSIATNSAKLNEWTAKLQQAEEKLMSLMDEWEQLFDR